MAELDIDDMRQMEAELQGMPLCNTRMTFYYDETGNCGKFKVTETGFNDYMALARDFILGGIAFDGEECPADVDSLFAALDLSSGMSGSVQKELVCLSDGCTPAIYIFIMHC